MSMSACFDEEYDELEDNRLRDEAYAFTDEMFGQRLEELILEEELGRIREQIDLDIETEKYLDQLELIEYFGDSFWSEYDADEFAPPRRISSRRAVCLEFSPHGELPRRAIVSYGYLRRNAPNRSRHKNVRNYRNY